MSDFLNFLNTADLDTLVKVTGITNPIAENIITARPFDSVEDCLKVHGMGKNLLARAQSSFEAGGNVSGSSAMVQVKEDPMPALVEKSQTAQESVEEQPSFLSRLGRAFVNFIRALFRLIALVILIGGIGAGLYYGLPFLNENIIVPIERNRSDVVQLRSEINALQTQLDETNARVETLEKSIEAHSASLTKLDEIQTSLENKIQTTQDETLLELKHEVMFTRALDMLGRARLYLAQSNFGLAQIDVQSARDLLVELQAETESAARKQAIERLDLALGNLPAFPVVAAGDLEIAWQILMTDTPAITSTATPTPAPLPTFTTTPTNIETLTPTPEPPSTSTSTAIP